jgi:predicted nucleic acid-binding protein
MKNFSTACLDANIVVKFIISSDETIGHLWENWRADGTRLVAPTLLHYEVVNSLHQYQKHGFLSNEALHRALDSALELPITLIGDAALHRRAGELAAAYRLPAAYDAHYLALAERLGIEFWTTDARLVNALQPFGLAWVRLAAEALAG